MDNDVIAQIRSELRLDRGRDWWQTQTRCYIDSIRTQRSKIKRGEIENLVAWLRESVGDISIVDIDLFSEYITLFVQLVVNVGDQGDIQIQEDLDRAFDEAIEFFVKNKRSPVDLYLARDVHLSKSNNEIKDREVMLKNALSLSFISPGDRIRAMLTLAQYYTAISEYDLAESIFLQCQQFLEEHPEEDMYRCRFLTLRGANYFSSSQNRKQAEMLLRQACQLIEQYPEELDVIRATSTAYHYLARLAEARGDLPESLRLHIIAKEYHERCPEELGATAFIHLRIGEILTHARAFDHARDHMLESHRLFRIMRDRGSGWAQVHLGFAMLEAAQGQHKIAEYNLMKAVQISRGCHYVPGEFLGLGLLLVSYTQSLRLIAAFLTLCSIAATIIRRELQEFGRYRLFSRFISQMSRTIRRITGVFHAKQRAAQNRLLHCPCPLHTREILMESDHVSDRMH
jgi:tetratricopeptide (TPR) repeat protein